MNGIHQVYKLCRAALSNDHSSQSVAELNPETLKLAQTLGVGSLVYRGLLKMGSHGQDLSALKREHDRYVSLHLLNQAPYEETIESFAEAYECRALSYFPLLLKGAHVRRSLYTDLPWARPMNDLDLLVHPRDLKAAQMTLRELGFARIASHGPSYHRRLSHAESWARHISDRHLVLVDLHTRLTHAMRNKGDADILHEQAISLNGEPPAWGLCLNHQIAHLALHLGHGFFRSGSRSLFDLLLLLDANPDFELNVNDPVVLSAQSSIFVALAAAGLLQEHNEYFNMAPWRQKLLHGLFKADVLFQANENPGGRIVDLIRALALMEDPKRAITYPGYVASVQIARRLGA